MLKPSTRRLLALVITVALLVQSVGPATAYGRTFSQQPEDDGSIFLPSIQVSGPPQFVINSPLPGSAIGGTLFFSIQPATPGSITRVQFQAGATDLGTDTTPADGFRVFVDAATLPAGTVQLRATATGPGGSTTQTSSVTVVPQPPASATLGPQGGVLATSRGSTLGFMPNSLPQGTKVSVVEKTQEQVTAETGIQWEDLGVTFLGAQTISATAPLSRPLGMVSSADYGQRVQPGQVVVNYGIVPDANGDGIAELVVMNSASVAPNGDVISDPIPQPVVLSPLTAGAQSAAVAALSGAPGTLIPLSASNFNAASLQGNTAVFRSLVNGAERQTPIVVVPHGAATGDQTLYIIIPRLPAGPATLMLHNLTTQTQVGPFAVTIEPPIAPSRPAATVIDEALAAALQALDEAAALGTQLGMDQPMDLATAKNAVTEARAAIQTMSQSPTAEDRQALNDLAVTLESAQTLGLLSFPGVTVAQGNPRETLAGIGTTLALMCIALLWVAPFAPLALLAATIVCAAAGITIFTFLLLTLPPTTPFSPSTTGMGAAPPTGGSGAGNAAAGGAGLYTAEQQALQGRFAVKVFSGGLPSPFTGMSDAGGYFYVPLIPQNEPFTALAIDTQTGETRTFQGTGPVEGQSVYIFFDFLHPAPDSNVKRWDGGGGDLNWSNPANWEGDTLPEIKSKVVIDIPGDAVVRFTASSATTIASLTSNESLEIANSSLEIVAASTIAGRLIMTTGELKVGGSLTVTGQLQWVRGDIHGPGVLNLNGGALLSGDFNKGLWGATVNNAGLFRIEGTGHLFGGNGATFNNPAAGVFELASDIDYAGYYLTNAGGTTFNNSGLILKSGGTGESILSATLNNSGTIEVRAGTLRLHEGGALTGGTYNVVAGAALEFGYAPALIYTFSGAISGAVAGTVRLAGATFSPAAGGATFNIPLTVDYGILKGPGTLTFTGAVVVSGVFDPTIDTITINNNGQWLLTTPGTTPTMIWGEGTTTFNNNGTFELRTAGGQNVTYAGSGQSGNAVTTFNNNAGGTVLKSGDSAIGTLDLCFVEAGGTVAPNATLVIADDCP